MREPQFIHDCDRCVFLGVAEKDGESVDLYYCPDNRPSLASLLARYGDDCSEYASSHPPEAFVCGVEPQTWERELIKRAKEAGVYAQPTPKKRMLYCACGKHSTFTTKDNFYCSVACVRQAEEA